MKKRQTLLPLLPLLALVTLSGCDAIRDSLPVGEVTIALSPGQMISVSGQNVPIQGFDECPSEESMMTQIIGSAPHNGDRTCLVISKDTSTVAAKVFLPSGEVTETWTVIREDVKAANDRAYKKISLRRPDGSLVVPATR